MRRRRVRMLVVVLGFIAAGCGPETPIREDQPSPPTRVELRVNAHADINPDGEGRPSPVLIRVYQLKSLAAFEAAGFFGLYEKDQEALGADLVRRDEIFLRPAESRDFAWEVPAATQFLAVVAAFRNLDTAQWRQSVSVPPQQTTAMTLDVQATQITLKTVRAQP